MVDMLLGLGTPKCHPQKDITSSFVFTKMVPKPRFRFVDVQLGRRLSPCGLDHVAQSLRFRGAVRERDHINTFYINFIGFLF